jgi:hypothetical protein
MAEATFQKALGALADENYRKSLAEDPTKLMRDFELSPGEQVILMAVGEACGGMPEVSGYMMSTSSSAQGGTYCCCCCCP